MMSNSSVSFVDTRSCAALRAADLGFLGQDAFRGSIFGRFPASLFRLWQKAKTSQTLFVTDAGSQLTFEMGEGGRGRNKQKRNRHFSLLTRGHNWPFRCLDCIWTNVKKFNEKSFKKSILETFMGCQ